MSERDELVRLDEPELAAHLVDSGDVADVWGLVRALAHGCPLDTAPDHIWRAYCEAMRDYARMVLADQLWSERKQRAEGAGR